MGSESGIVPTVCSSAPDHHAQIPSKRGIWRILFPPQGDFGLAARFWLMRMLNTTDKPREPSGTLIAFLLHHNASVSRLLPGEKLSWSGEEALLFREKALLFREKALLFREKVR